MSTIRPSIGEPTREVRYSLTSSRPATRIISVTLWVDTPSMRSRFISASSAVTSSGLGGGLAVAAASALPPGGEQPVAASASASSAVTASGRTWRFDGRRIIFACSSWQVHEGRRGQPLEFGAGDVQPVAGLDQFVAGQAVLALRIEEFEDAALA